VTVFAVAILLGTAVLALPWAHVPGRVSVLDALFTATSAVCVTGLVVVDTGSDYTAFGQVVILVLIQLGGLGIMTFAAVAFHLSGARLPLATQAAVEDSLFQRDTAVEFRDSFRRILWIVALVESVGALVLFLALVRSRSLAHAAWSAVFHSVSAFCNAGFSIYRDSLTGMRDDAVALGAVMALIVLGGLGHVVLLELGRDAGRMLARRRRERPHRFSLHVRVVLWSTAALAAGGTVALWLTGLSSGAETGRFFSGALFQSITARTAGFNTVDVGALPLAALVVTIALMTVGGSPGSCAGGIKTTSFAIWVARLRGSLHGRDEITLFGRRIPGQLMLKATAVIGLTVAWNAVGVVVLSIAEPACTSLTDVMFEQVSAFATVGLSTGLTPQFGIVGRLWLVLSMYVGRLGPLTLVLSFLRTGQPRVGYPEGRMMIG
jgi:trk system potassium uptake protein TrkH